MDSFFDKLPTYPPEDISFLCPDPKYKSCRHIVVSTSCRNPLEGELIFTQTYINNGYIAIIRYVRGKDLTHVAGINMVNSLMPTMLYRITGLVRISVVRQFMDMQITMRQLWEQCEVIFLPIYNDLSNPMIVSFDDVKDLVLSRD